MWNSESIKELRKSLDLSQSEFSKKLGIREQTVSEWETGVYSPRGGSITLLDIAAKEVHGDKIICGVFNRTKMRKIIYLKEIQ